MSANSLLYRVRGECVNRGRTADFVEAGNPPVPGPCPKRPLGQLRAFGNRKVNGSSQRKEVAAGKRFVVKYVITSLGIVDEQEQT